jgi:hypothetical protein
MWSNNEATSLGLGDEELDKREVHENLSARKEQLRKLVDDDDVVKTNTVPPTSYRD